MKVWELSEEWFHNPEKNRIIAYFSARYSRRKIETFLEQLAHIEFYSHSEQLSLSRYHNPLPLIFPVVTNRKKAIVSVGHEPRIVAQLIEIDPDAVIAKEQIENGLTD